VGRSWARAVAILLTLVVLAACGSSAPRSAGDVSTTLTTEPAPSTTEPSAPTTTTAPAPAPTSTTPAPTSTIAAPRTTQTTPAPDPALARAGAAGQAVVVTADRYGATTATFTAYQRDGETWRQAFGPWTARIGTQGLAPPGQKREGDGRTPSGVYGFDFLFGVAPDPGVKFPYRRVTDRIVWDDDPASPLYNTWVDLDRQRAGAEPEPMYVSPVYDHGAVIAYNTDRTPGLGSAIFLHISNGGPTAGCVSLPSSQLVEVLRWLDPSRSPRIVLGVAT
jgi:L,D-peptidoglycan transpeptidase YkuD (ErfK/YbiS/YcfS/YnhG family)